MGNCGRNYNYSDSGWQQLVLGALASPPCWRTGDDDDDDGDDVGGLAKVAIIIMVMRMVAIIFPLMTMMTISSAKLPWS